MARRWTSTETNYYRNELHDLYVVQNKSIGEVGEILCLAESSVFKRLQRLGIESMPERKEKYFGGLKEITIPKERTRELAEFFGIMLGDGHVSHFQTIVTLGSKELLYVEYVSNLMRKLFKTPATICVRSDGYRDVYISSVILAGWLANEGLVSNKVASQVVVPEWISEKLEFMQAFLKGFFDTDGSVYKIRFGIQISLTNHSLPLLYSLREMFIRLEYCPSKVSAYRVYITRKLQVRRFFSEVKPANTKHLRRFENLTRR